MPQPQCQDTARMNSKRTESIRVLVVDDHRTFADAIAVAIGLERGFETRVAASGPEALESIRRDRPDVVLMDIQMPGMDGIEAIRRVRDVDPNAPILVLSAHDEDLLKARAVEAGAIGYVSKEIPLTELPDLIREAHHGELLMEVPEMNRLLRLLRHRRHQDSTERQRANRLSPRQMEILQLMADGLSARDIAGHLNMSPLTLRTHVQNILMRLGVHTKVEALAVAIRHGKVSSTRTAGE